MWLRRSHTPTQVVPEPSCRMGCFSARDRGLKRSASGVATPLATTRTCLFLFVCLSSVLMSTLFFSASSSSRFSFSHNLVALIIWTHLFCNHALQPTNHERTSNPTSMHALTPNPPPRLLRRRWPICRSSFDPDPVSYADPGPNRNPSRFPSPGATYTPTRVIP